MDDGSWFHASGPAYENVVIATRETWSSVYGMVVVT